MGKSYNPARYPVSMTYDETAREIAALVEQVRTEGHAISSSGNVEIEPMNGPAYESAVCFIATAMRHDAESFRALMARLGYAKAGDASRATT